MSDRMATYVLFTVHADDDDNDDNDDDSDDSLIFYSIDRQADRAYGTEINPRLFVVTFVILLYAILYNICI
jgi:hypothetical protein